MLCDLVAAVFCACFYSGFALRGHFIGDLAGFAERFVLRKLESFLRIREGDLLCLLAFDG